MPRQRTRRTLSRPSISQGKPREGIRQRAGPPSSPANRRQRKDARKGIQSNTITPMGTRTFLASQLRHEHKQQAEENPSVAMSLPAIIPEGITPQFRLSRSESGMDTQPEHSRPLKQITEVKSPKNKTHDSFEHPPKRGRNHTEEKLQGAWQPAPRGESPNGSRLNESHRRAHEESRGKPGVLKISNPQCVGSTADITETFKEGLPTFLSPRGAREKRDSSIRWRYGRGRRRDPAQEPKDPAWFVIRHW